MATMWNPGTAVPGTIDIGSRRMSGPPLSSTPERDRQWFEEERRLAERGLSYAQQFTNNQEYLRQREEARRQHEMMLRENARIRDELFRAQPVGPVPWIPSPNDGTVFGGENFVAYYNPISERFELRQDAQEVGSPQPPPEPERPARRELDLDTGHEVQLPKVVARKIEL